MNIGGTHIAVCRQTNVDFSYKHFPLIQNYIKQVWSHEKKDFCTGSTIQFQYIKIANLDFLEKSLATSLNYRTF